MRPESAEAARNGWTLDVLAETPLGSVIVVSRARRTAAVVPGFESTEAARKFALGRYGICPEREKSEAARQIEEYLRGRRRELTLEGEIAHLPSFYRRALEACARIPYGSVATYGQVAAAAGSPRACRAAGAALRANPCPIVIPCHRVVAAGGPGGFSARGGLDTKAALLRIEGVRLERAGQKGLGLRREAR